MNSSAKQIQGLAKRVQICLGEFSDQPDFMIMDIVDFKVILGNTFFVSACIGGLPYLGVMVMYRGNACFVWGHSKPTGVGDLKTNEGQLVVWHLAMGTEQKSSTHLADMIYGERASQ